MILVERIYKVRFLVLAWVLLSTVLDLNAQQEPQYTQYQYNTMTVNPAYTGSLGYPSIVGLYRSQWLGLEGSPKTISLGIDSPFRLFSGIGLSIVRDELGPSEETYFDVNYSHSLIVNRSGNRLAFGLKGGGKYLSVDWSKGRHKDPDVLFNENINGRFLPTAGVGVFYYSDKFYLGLSTPNVLYNIRYDDIAEAVGTDRIHLYLIAGYVFDMSPSLKFKPSIFGKYVAGAPLIGEVSLNFMINESLILGGAYRWDDSIGLLAGFMVSPRMQLGYAYDYPLNNLGNYHSGSHEIFLKYHFIPVITKIKSPRFF